MTCGGEGGSGLGGGGTRRAGSWAAGRLGARLRGWGREGHFRRRARRWWSRAGEWAAAARAAADSVVAGSAERSLQGRGGGGWGLRARCQGRIRGPGRGGEGGGACRRLRGSEGGGVSAAVWRRRGAARGSSGGEDGRLGCGGDREEGGGRERWRPWRQWSDQWQQGQLRQGRWQTCGGGEGGRPHHRTAPS